MTLNAKTAKTLSVGRSDRRLITVAPTDLASEALGKMRDSQIHHLVVMRDEKCVGMVSARELVTATKADHWYGAGRSVTVAEIMRTHVPTLDENADIGTALTLMLENSLTGLPLTREGVVTDIVTETDLLRLLQQLGGNEGHDDSTFRAQGEAAMANPMVQNLMHSLASAGI